MREKRFERAMLTRAVISIYNPSRIYRILPIAHQRSNGGSFRGTPSCSVRNSFAMPSISKLSRTLATLRIEAEMADAHALKLQQQASQDSGSSISSELLRMAAEEIDMAEQIRQRMRLMNT